LSARGAGLAGQERMAALDVALVVAAHGRHVVIETPEGRRVMCHPRGKKLELVVGDQVRWQATGDGGVVEQLEPRRNLMFRQDEWRTKSFASNLDQVLVLVAGEPVFSEMQLARALIAAQAADIPTLIGLNKTDLESAKSARERLLPYRTMGIDVVELALKTEAGAAVDKLRAHLSGRVTLVLGASGMGKSTLINLLVPSAEAQTGEVSHALGAGRHTTTATRWYWLGEEREGALIDSPGFQEFGLRQIAPEQLAPLMPDYAAALGNCRFHNCTHRQEPGCGVNAAAAQGLISPTRQRIYAALYEELSLKRW
jgi:ribosome biogenesis GTPase